MRRAVLGLDCTGETFGCGLLVDGRHFTGTTGLSPRRALRELPAHVGYLLKKAGLDHQDLGGIGVTQGPGSFTGVRLGITLAKTAAFSAGCGVFPVDTLRLLAAEQERHFSHQPGTVAVALDARKKEIYAFLSGDEKARLMKPSDFAQEIGSCKELRCLLGPGFEAYPELIPGDFKGPVLALREHSAPSMSLLCQMTRDAQEEERLLSYGQIEPVYLRKADVQVSGGGK